MIKKALIFVVISYKKLISPFLPRACRFYPSCSDYCIQSIDKHGPVWGIALSFVRLLRCNPYFKGGIDPVR